MNTNKIKELILEESKRSGITLTEDELNAKVLALSQIDDEKLERISGGEGETDNGFVFNCDSVNYCWSDILCVTWSKGGEE